MKIKKKQLYFIAAGVAVVCIVVLGILLLFPKKNLSLLDQSGREVIQVTKKYDFSDHKMAYFDMAITEATQILAKQKDCSIEDARDMLWKDEYQIYTYYQQDVQVALAKSCKPYNDRFDCGGVVTDLDGNVVAAYGHSVNESSENYAMHTASPYSSIKPLSVYAQAIEKGIINWSTVYEDSPYKQIKGADDKMRDWPVNASGQYENTNVTIYEAIRESLNTVAVKCLKDVGVDNSIEFLQNNFGISLVGEQYTSVLYEEEEVIGNIAMGYFQTGVAPVDMAGYYQIFATGGTYVKPSAVYQICDKDGEVVYERGYNPQEIISPHTADIMNKLLQGVAKTGGTGVEAYCESTEVAGKTGSADANADCWFVGLTPEYSCAIWHSKNYKNMAPVLFSRTMEEVHKGNEELKNVFGMHSNLRKYLYCEESGMAVSPNCTLTQLGYYVPGTELKTCNQH